ncbi:hypothetical protein PAXINDRAFT_21577 [Paxillus involutus ATCC 200175]|uniref:Uncharacterized protein n=1 Tax=Paxillus involutus ATCC 200175 TaxID=664439 RepID=A0A0C9T0Z2_PAXIN|nr:hypothetical protein PAXINDRAFT_21577 [Paxillus involutus ATCC 200175]
MPDIVIAPLNIYLLKVGTSYFSAQKVTLAKYVVIRLDNMKKRKTSPEPIEENIEVQPYPK